ncbi:hypothetical protein MYSTI_01907 [Myxococcus stipitatus DSM 14675]|uniref:DUF4031 domain-containing protein n=1 Tax=Myxococcus stipitatus (strain DSM 14675 / JCM 12634 / Mx s8) TaxID=1278073 RepID=L7U516_MYXSD|nr:DUF4031 domain-containing protein [Myxococcus stipitatus]AGC43238.1 hypothetical protein MYSTI_01907 [Myxococcus stipitatus DSM 14675]
MTVYVDQLVPHPPPKDPATRRAGARHGHRWCHLLCDPDGEAELHAMAARIGLKREWFQAPPNASKPHYDLTPPVRADALAWGAVELERDGLRAYFARWNEHLAQRSAQR